MDCTFIGMIGLYPYSRAPEDAKKCDGSLLSIQDNQVLYSLIGNKFGGTGNQFAIPNLQGFEPEPSMQYYICMNGTYPQRQ